MHKIDNKVDTVVRMDKLILTVRQQVFMEN